MPGQGSPLVSASGQVFLYRSPSPFRVPTAPCSPFSTNAVSFFWGRSLLLLGRLDLRLDPSGLKKSAACPPLSLSTVTGRLPLSLFSHLVSSSVFSHYYLSDIRHEFDGLLSLGHFVAAGSRIG